MKCMWSRHSTSVWTLACVCILLLLFISQVTWGTVIPWSSVSSSVRWGAYLYLPHKIFMGVKKMKSCPQWHDPVSGAVITGGSNWTSLDHGQHVTPRPLERVGGARRPMLFSHLPGWLPEVKSCMRCGAAGPGELQAFISWMPSVMSQLVIQPTFTEGLLCAGPLVSTISAPPAPAPWPEDCWAEGLGRSRLFPLTQVGCILLTLKASLELRYV